jgi:hypothetical protein
VGEGGGRGGDIGGEGGVGVEGGGGLIWGVIFFGWGGGRGFVVWGVGGGVVCVGVINRM